MTINEKERCRNCEAARYSRSRAPLSSRPTLPASAGCWGLRDPRGSKTHRAVRGRGMRRSKTHPAACDRVDQPRPARAATSGRDGMCTKCGQYFATEESPIMWPKRSATADRDHATLGGAISLFAAPRPHAAFRGPNASQDRAIQDAGAGSCYKFPHDSTRAWVEAGRANGGRPKPRAGRPR